MPVLSSYDPKAHTPATQSDIQLMWTTYEVAPICIDGNMMQCDTVSLYRRDAVLELSHPNWLCAEGKVISVEPEQLGYLFNRCDEEWKKRSLALIDFRVELSKKTSLTMRDISPEKWPICDKTKKFCSDQEVNRLFAH